MLLIGPPQFKPGPFVLPFLFSSAQNILRKFHFTSITPLFANSHSESNQECLPSRQNKFAWRLDRQQQSTRVSIIGHAPSLSRTAPNRLYSATLSTYTTTPRVVFAMPFFANGFKLRAGRQPRSNIVAAKSAADGKQAHGFYRTELCYTSMLCSTHVLSVRVLTATTVA